jgi:hypothetical protein
MILVFEQDTRTRNGRRFSWKGLWFTGVFDGRRTWRVGWGMWSLSYYAAPSLRDFFRYVEGGYCRWFKS